MSYTIQQFARKAGVTTRTLRWYDQIGLLQPQRVTAAGYRLYGDREVDLLQQILFYRELGMPLDEIRAIVTRPSFDLQKALAEHHRELLARRDRLDRLITTVEHTLAWKKGETTMSDSEKFAAFKQEKLTANEQNYGEEIRARYGLSAVEAANRSFMGLSEEEWRRMQQVEEEMFDALREVRETGDLLSDAARSAYERHKDWLGFTWSSYSPDAHAGLAEGYVADERFTAYYDSRAGDGTARLLRDVIVTWAGKRE